MTSKARWLPWALLGGAAAFMLGGSEGSSATGVPAGGKRRVLLAGDSHAVGLAPRLGELLIAAGWPVAADPRGGTSALQWRSWIAGDLATFGPDLVLISLGGNDFRTTRPADVATAIGDIARQVKATGAALWWLDPRLEGTSLVDRVGVCEWWRAVATRVLVPGPTVTIAQDSIHATLGGYRAWAEDIAAELGVSA